MKGPQIVIAAYRPKAGKEKVLEKLVADHAPTLQELGFATDRERVVMRRRRHFLEIFEWASAEASSKAHDHPAVAQIWEAMAKVADFVKIADLPESKKSFAHFAPVEL